MYINDSAEQFDVASENDYQDVHYDFGTNTPKFIIIEKVSFLAQMFQMTPSGFNQHFGKPANTETPVPFQSHYN